MQKQNNVLAFQTSFLSQWYGSSTNSHPFAFRGHNYNCPEQAMMHQKALLFKDFDTASEIKQTFNPKEQKALGRKVQNFDPKVWDKVKFSLVLGINQAKFSQHEDLKQKTH